MSEAVQALRKVFLVGVGATVKTVDKVGELLEDLVKKGDMKPQDAKQLLDNLRNRATTEVTNLEQTVKNAMQALERSVDFVSRKEFDALCRELKVDPKDLKQKAKDRGKGKGKGKKSAKTSSKFKRSGKSPQKATSKPGAKKSYGKKTTAKKTSAKSKTGAKPTIARKKTAKAGKGKPKAKKK